MVAGMTVVAVLVASNQSNQHPLSNLGWNEKEGERENERRGSVLIGCYSTS